MEHFIILLFIVFCVVIMRLLREIYFSQTDFLTRTKIVNKRQTNFLDNYNTIDDDYKNYIFHGVYNLRVQ
jgi:hypothetical protein